jgi:acyl carrier protein
MTKAEIKTAILEIFEEQFEISNPSPDDDLREAYEFDSIDAIELLREIEVLLRRQLSRPEKVAAMDIRTINQIVEYVENLAVQGAEPA